MHFQSMYMTEKSVFTLGWILFFLRNYKRDNTTLFFDRVALTLSIRSNTEENSSSDSA